MEGLNLYNFNTIEKYISRREGETKFGEKIQFINSIEDLKSSNAKYVLLGIPEDIGVRANSGKAGTENSWKACLKSLVNIQANRYTHPENVLLLGEIDCRVAMEKSQNIDKKDPNYFAKLGDLVKIIDSAVTHVITNIIAAGKIPVIIGGGHNNAYGIIKGTSIAAGKGLNVLNIDAHTDLRSTELRHSGNGFSFAKKEQFLANYRMFGIHQNYTPDYIFKRLDSSPDEHYRLFEHLILKSSQDIIKAFREELDFVRHQEFGIELDCDSIKDFSSSAQSPSGFSFNMIRNFISIASEEEKIKYLHICEAAAFPENELQIGKALSYLITDFIKPAL